MDSSLASPHERPSQPAIDGGSPTVPAIGIDLGTTYSVIAYLDPQGRPTSVPNAEGDLLTPSVVLFDDDGIVVGKQAVAAASLEPEKVADCVKRDIGGKHYHRQINGRWYPPEVISAYILQRLKADAERKLGPIRKAVITVPAYFDETRRRATMDAGKLAGLEVLDIINEPTAAAIAYGYQAGFLDRSGKVDRQRPLRVLVFDLGGGTFDVTLVEIASQSFKALATDGDVLLGGKDWDEKLVEIAAGRLAAQIGEDARRDPATLHELTFAAEAAKRAPSERTKTTLIVHHAGQRLKVDVTRQEFEEATLPLVLRTRTARRTGGAASGSDLARDRPRARRGRLDAHADDRAHAQRTGRPRGRSLRRARRGRGPRRRAVCRHAAAKRRRSWLLQFIGASAGLAGPGQALFNGPFEPRRRFAPQRSVYNGRYCVGRIKGPADAFDTVKYDICRSGGMADALDSKSSDRKVVRVQ